MNKDNINMTQPYPAGYLEIILGSMYSGKSTRIVEIYNQCKLCNIPVIVINHTIDTRYDTDYDNDILSTHDKVKIPCMKIERLMDLCFELSDIDVYQDISPKIKDKFKIITSKVILVSEVILINEGQFFPDLEKFVKLLLNHGKKVYVCGLDGDFEMTSLCSICKNGTPGIFSMRLTHETDQTVVGSDNYIPVCRSCYVKKIY